MPGDVTLQNCLGSILLEGIAQEHGSGAFRLDVDQCAQVQISHCLFHGANASYDGVGICLRSIT